MKDFLGQELKVGDYLVSAGAGNTKAEYGLILYQILGFKNSNVQCERLWVRYDWYDEKNHRLKEALVSAGKRKTTLKKVTRIAKVIPPTKMIDVFQNPEDHPELVSKWLHGMLELDWE